ncbi:MAG: EAL domain-containing protein [Pseudomonadota bacterium]
MTKRSNLSGLLTMEDAAPRTTVNRALRTVREHLGMDVAYISDLSGDTWELLAVDAQEGCELGPVGLKMPKDCTLCYHTASGNLAPILPDARKDPFATTFDAVHALDVGAHISVPLLDENGTAYGMFCCYSNDPNHTLSPRDQRVMEAFADVAAVELRRELLAERNHRERALRIERVLTGGRVRPVFQPIVNIATGRMFAMEALSRFDDGEYRAPPVWLSDAETVGMRNTLEIHAIKTALKAAPFDRGVAVSLNMSPALATDKRLAEVLAGAPLERVILEVTEHCAVRDYAGLEAALHPLRAAGLRLAVDDVGGGYASLNHTLQLSPDIIKADMSLVRGLDHDPARHSLMTAMVQFSQGVGADLIAEGVETADELAALKGAGVALAQGYYIARPGPARAARDVTWTDAGPMPIKTVAKRFGHQGRDVSSAPPQAA